MRRQPHKQPKTLENLLQQAEDYSQYMMTGSGGWVPPTLMALTAEGFIMHVPHRFNFPDVMDLFAKTIRLMAVGYKAWAVAMIYESWILTENSRVLALDFSVHPSESLDREEVISIMADSREARDQRFLFIQRDSSGKFTGFEKRLLLQIQEVEGRFVDLLPPEEPTDEMALAAKSMLHEMGITIENLGSDPTW